MLALPVLLGCSGGPELQFVGASTSLALCDLLNGGGGDSETSSMEPKPAGALKDCGSSSDKPTVTCKRLSLM
jgi:hypothetical protein